METRFESDWSSMMLCVYWCSVYIRAGLKSRSFGMERNQRKLEEIFHWFSISSLPLQYFSDKSEKKNREGEKCLVISSFLGCLCYFPITFINLFSLLFIDDCAHTDKMYKCFFSLFLLFVKLFSVCTIPNAVERSTSTKTKLISFETFGWRCGNAESLMNNIDT